MPYCIAIVCVVILNGTINITSTTASNLITAQNPVEFVSFSGGIVDCGGKAIEAISFPSQTMAYIDQVTVGNCGIQTNRTTSNLIHLAGGKGYNIIHGNTLNGGGGRGIWTQSSSSRYIVLENHISKVNEDGVDFDSSTSNSAAIDNVRQSAVRCFY